MKNLINWFKNLSLTGKLILIGVIFYVIYDIVAVSMGWFTLSRVIIAWSQVFIFLPYAYGVLAIHFFYPHKQGIKTWQLITFISISVIVLAYCIASLFMHDPFTEFLKRYPVIMLFAGMPVGYFWVQKNTKVIK